MNTEIHSIEMLESMTNDRQELIDKLRWFMRTKQITIEDLSKSTGLHYQTLINIFQKKRKGTPETWQKIITGLHLNYVEIQMMRFQDVCEKLYTDSHKYDGNQETTVYCEPYEDFVYCCDYQFGDKEFKVQSDNKEGFYIHVTLDETVQLFTHQHPLRISE